MSGAGDACFLGLRRLFDRSFELICDPDPSIMEEVYRLRFRVLCEQEALEGFEPWRYPDGRERDVYDRRSVFCALRSRRTGSIAGCVRLILADRDDPEALFPVEEASRRCFIPEFSRPAGSDRLSYAEISRVLVPFNGARGAPGGRDGEVHRSDEFPYPILGLLQGVNRLAMRHGVTHAYAIMEPRLNRLLGRFGLHFDPVGPVIEHHGRRQAFVGDLAGVVRRTAATRREVWDLVTDGGELFPPEAPEAVRALI